MSGPIILRPEKGIEPLSRDALMFGMGQSRKKREEKEDHNIIAPLQALLGDQILNKIERERCPGSFTTLVDS